MNVFVLIAGNVLVWITAATAYAETADDRPRAKVVPLKEIWAHEMPGTRDVRELEKGVLPPNQRASLTEQIGGVLRFVPKGQTVAKALAVAGTEKDALRNANAILVNKQQPQQSFSANSNIFVVFFSHSFGQFVHLDHVERGDKTIEIAYRFVPHKTKQMTAHFALIPLGKFSAGKYRVDIVRLPLEQKYVAQGFKSADRQWESRVVCQPFSFTVK